LARQRAGAWPGAARRLEDPRRLAFSVRGPPCSPGDGLASADLPILRAFRGGAGRLGVVAHRVHRSAGPPPPPAPQDLWPGFGIPFPKTPGIPVGMFLANHTKNKGVNVLLDAFDAYDGPFRMIVAGSQRDYLDYARYTRPRRPDQSFHFPGFVTDQEVSLLLD